MRASPSICGIDGDVHLVLDDFGAVIDDLWEGQYSNPVCVIGFNLSEGWVRDVSED
jgi:hypothetical protein